MSKSNISVGTKGWADRINAAWRKSAAAFIEIGQLLIECKESVGHGAFKKMLTSTELDFEENAAQRLMAIARDTRLSNPSNLRFLPTAVTVLHKLTKLPDDQLEQAFKSGEINPKTRGKDVPKPRKELGVVPTEALRGAAVLDIGDGAARVPDTDIPTPQDEREVEDSGVTSYEYAPNLTSSGEVKSLIGEESPVTPLDDNILFLIGPAPMSRLANGLALAMAASREIAPNAAADAYPETMPLLTEDVDAFVTWLDEFLSQFHVRYGAGNDAGLELP